MTQIQENLGNINSEINKISAQYKVNSNNIDLIAVSKQQPDERIQYALDANHRVFGENRVQEAQQRWQDIRPHYPDLRLHLIGPLQTNKVKDAVALFDFIHTIDRPKLARAVAKEVREQQRNVTCFIQVNTGAEEQKSGVLPADLPTLLQLCYDEGLSIAGLMCIPPQDDLPALHFSFLRQLAQQHNLNDLSMGMSGDYQRAIALAPENGKLYLRVGTGVFGTRV